MKNSPFYRWIGVAVSSVASLLAGHAGHAKPLDFKELSKGKKAGTGQTKGYSQGMTGDNAAIAPQIIRQYPWRLAIVTTTFWIGEKPTPNNPVPNRTSCWDPQWAANYGGTDSPDRHERTTAYTPTGFVPRQNPFYVALPYNDMCAAGHKPEAAQVIPWYHENYQGPNKSVCQCRWIAIRKGNRVCYAQWEDAGPFRTDHPEYVFGTDRPKPNLNQGAGLDVSPAVRDFLGMDDSDKTDWKFVDFGEVPAGPWATFGDNNTFVINRRAAQKRELAMTSLQRMQPVAAE